MERARPSLLLTAASCGLAIFYLSLYCASAHAQRVTCPADSKTCAQVLTEDQQLNQAQEAASNKQNQANDYLSERNSALTRAAWSLFRKRYFKAKAARANEAYRTANQEAATAEQQTLQEAQDYLKAEDAYYAENGGYLKPRQYNYWKSRVSYLESQQEEQSQEPQRPEDVHKQFNKTAQDIFSGDSDLGTFVEKSRKLTGLADKIQNNAYDTLIAQNTPGMPSAPGGASASGAGSQGIGYKTPGWNPSRAPSLSAKPLLLSPQRPGDPWSRRGGKESALDDARRLSAMGDYDTALRKVDEAIARYPRSDDAYAAKSTILNRMRRFGEAEAAAKRALALNRENKTALKNLVWAQLHQRKADEAAANASQLIRLNPDDPQAYLMRAFAYELMGEREKMLADLKHAAELDPRYRNHYLRAKAGLKLFDPDAADSAKLLEAITAPPAPEGNPYLGLGIALFSAALALLLWGAGRKLRSRTVGAASVGASEAVAPVSGTVAPVPEVSEAPPGIGEVLAGKYIIRSAEEESGQTVYSAEDRSLGREVLIRRTPVPEGGAGRLVREQCRRESQMLGGLHHPNIVDLFEVLDLPSGFYWVFEKVEGKTLRRILDEKKCMPYQQAKAFLTGVCRALAEAHRLGLVHRNLQPERIILTKQMEVKVAGFSPLTERSLPASAYRAPETAKGAASPATDIYALALCLYEMTAGKRPSVPPEPLGEAAPGLDELMAACLETEPAARIQDVPTFCARL